MKQEYNIKPIANKSAGSVRAEKKALTDKKKETAELEAKKAHHAKQEALTKEIIASSNTIAQKIDDGSERVTQSMEELSKRVDKIKLEIPKQDNSDIVSAINGFSETTQELFSQLSESVANIKLESKEIDLKPHTEALTDTIDQNISSLESVIGKLTESVSKIKLEAEPPAVEWVFDVTRNEKGYIEQIHAVAPEIIDG